ncbi:MAG: NUDIX domain-containing protein [Microbacteriaceae bacterium]|nr:NUDIX domain-containing protein [Microbacteriaceae bacterium]MCL2793864.1 NUDIX domain-containing protein [Microbacteriaceae bacterium]
MPSIRNIAVGFHVRSGCVLVLDGVDRVAGEAFHRAVGGGIEFGETAEAALRREFREELDVALDQVELLGVTENLFEYEGQPGHEIVHVFGVESVDLAALPLDAHLIILDEGSPVSWRPIDGLDRPLYPSGTFELLQAWNRRTQSE